MRGKVRERKGGEGRGEREGGERGGGGWEKNSRGEKDEVNMLGKEESHPPDEAALHDMIASRFHSQDGPHALQLPQQLFLGLAGSCSVD